MAPPADGSFALATADDICGLCSCLKILQILKHLKSSPTRQFIKSCSEFLWSLKLWGCPRQCSGRNHEGWGHGYNRFVSSIESLWHLDSTRKSARFPRRVANHCKICKQHDSSFSSATITCSFLHLPSCFTERLHSSLYCSSWGALHGQLWDLLSHFKWHLPPVMDMCYGDIAQLDWASQSCPTMYHLAN